MGVPVRITSSCDQDFEVGQEWGHDENLFINLPIQTLGFPLCKCNPIIVSVVFHWLCQCRWKSWIHCPYCLEAIGFPGCVFWSTMIRHTTWFCEHGIARNSPWWPHPSIVRSTKEKVRNKIKSLEKFQPFNLCNKWSVGAFNSSCTPKLCTIGISMAGHQNVCFQKNPEKNVKTKDSQS